MTDEEIMLGIKYCHDKEAGCDYCPYAIYLAKDCDTNLMNDALDLINRQQAEAESWKRLYENTCAELNELLSLEREIKEQAIKEFVEKLIAMLAKYDMYGTLYIIEDIDNLVKEMVGADNGKT